MERYYQRRVDCRRNTSGSGCGQDSMSCGCPTPRKAPSCGCQNPPKDSSCGCSAPPKGPSCGCSTPPKGPSCGCSAPHRGPSCGCSAPPKGPSCGCQNPSPGNPPDRNPRPGCPCQPVSLAGFNVCRPGECPPAANEGLAMGYVPWQQWECTYPLHQGLFVGTVFPSLDKPFLIGRCAVRP